MGFWKKQNHQLPNTQELQRTGRQASHVTGTTEGSGDHEARSSSAPGASNRKSRSTSQPKSSQPNAPSNNRSASADPRNRSAETSVNVNSAGQHASNRTVASPQPKHSRHQQQGQPQVEQRVQQQRQQPNNQQSRQQKQRPPQNQRQEQRQQQQHGQSKSQQQQRQQPQHQEQPQRQQPNQHQQRQQQHRQQQQQQNPQQQRQLQQEQQVQRQQQQHQRQNKQEEQQQRKQQQHPHSRQKQQHELPRQQPQPVQQQQQRPRQEQQSQQQQQQRSRQQQQQLSQQQQRPRQEQQAQQPRQKQQQQQQPPQAQRPQEHRQRQQANDQHVVKTPRQREDQLQTVAAVSSSGAKAQQHPQPKQSASNQQQSGQHLRPAVKGAEQPTDGKSRKRDVSPLAATNRQTQPQHAAVRNPSPQPGPSTQVATAKAQSHQPLSVANQQQYAQAAVNQQRQHVAIKRSLGSPEPAKTSQQAGRISPHPTSSSVAGQQKSQGQVTVPKSSSQPAVSTAARVASTSPKQSEPNQSQALPGQFVAVSVPKYQSGAESSKSPTRPNPEIQSVQQKQPKSGADVLHTKTLPMPSKLSADTQHYTLHSVEHQRNNMSSSVVQGAPSSGTHKTQVTTSSKSSAQTTSLPVDRIVQKSPEGSDNNKEAQTTAKQAVSLPTVTTENTIANTTSSSISGLAHNTKSVKVTPASSLSGLSDNSGANSKKSLSSDNQSVSGNVVMLSLDADGVRSSGRSTVSVKMDSSSSQIKPETSDSGKSAMNADSDGITLQTSSTSHQTVGYKEQGISKAATLDHPKTVAVAQSEIISVPVPRFNDLKGTHNLALPKADSNPQSQQPNTLQKSLVSTQGTVSNTSHVASVPSSTAAVVSDRSVSNAPVFVPMSAQNSIQTFVTSVPRTAIVALIPEASSPKAVALVPGKPEAGLPSQPTAIPSSSGSTVVTVATKTGVTSQPALFVVPKTAAVSLATVHKKVATTSLVSSSPSPKPGTSSELDSKQPVPGVSTSVPASGSREVSGQSQTSAIASIVASVKASSSVAGNTPRSASTSVASEVTVPKQASVAAAVVGQSGSQPRTVSSSTPSSVVVPPVASIPTSSVQTKPNAQSREGVAVKVSSTTGSNTPSSTGSNIHSSTGSNTHSAVAALSPTATVPKVQPSSTSSSHTEANTRATETPKTSEGVQSVATSIATVASSVSQTVVSAIPKTVASSQAIASGSQAQSHKAQAASSTLASSNKSNPQNVAGNAATVKHKGRAKTTSPTAGKFQIQASSTSLPGNRGQVMSSSGSAASSPVRVAANVAVSSSGTSTQAPAQTQRSIAVSSTSQVVAEPSTATGPTAPIAQAATPVGAQARNTPYERIHSQTIVTSFSGVSESGAPRQETRVNHSESSGTARPQTVAVTQVGNSRQIRPVAPQDGESSAPQAPASAAVTQPPVVQSTARQEMPSQNTNQAQQRSGPAPAPSQLSGTTGRQTVAVAQSYSPSLNSARQPQRQAAPQPTGTARESDRDRRAPTAHHPQNVTNMNQNQNSRSLDPSDLQIDVLNSQTRQLDLPQIHTTGLSAGVVTSRPSRQEALPDILNSHVQPRGMRQNRSRAGRQEMSQYQGRVVPPGMTQLEDDEKQCCSRAGCLCCVTEVTRFRWVLVFLALLGVTCVIIGTVLGALHMTSNTSYLTLSLMFIGLGVVLVVVVGVAWKCTPTGHEPCHMLFSLGSHMVETVVTSPSNRGNNRTGRNRSNWSGGVLYPEFRFRRPPPSYNASMQDYQQQLMLAQMQLNEPDNTAQDNYSLPSSPPPTYKSRASTIRPGLHITFPPTQSDQPSSRPPTYRSSRNSERPSLPMVPSQTEEHPSSRVLEYLQGVLQNSPNRVSQASLSHSIQSCQASQPNQNSQNDSNQHHTHQSQSNQDGGDQNVMARDSQGQQSRTNNALGNEVRSARSSTDGDTDIEAIADTPL